MTLDADADADAEVRDDAGADGPADVLAAPLFEQVAETVRTSIDERTLVPGDRAPSLRALARRLNVSVATVVRAYEQLEREGRLTARSRSGYFVAERPLTGAARRPRRPSESSAPRPVRTGEHIDEIIESAREPGVMPFGLANPASALFPSKALTRSLRAVSARSPETLLDYAPLAGEPDLRHEIAARASRLGAPVAAADVVVTSGATEALALALGVVAKPGETIVIESPAYFGLLRLLESLGLSAVGIDTDPVHGLEPAALERVLTRERVAAVVSIGTFGNPTGSLVPDAARQAIVELVARHRVALVEDDIYADLHAGVRRPLPYRAFDTRGVVLTCSSFSKTVAPGFRIGWVLSATRREALLRRKLIASGSSPRLTQLAMARFLAEGRYDRHVARLRRAFREQLDCLRAAVHRHFPLGTESSEPAGGFVLWVRLPGGVDTRELYRLAIAEGISLAPGTLFSTGRAYRDRLRLAAGEPWTPRHENAIARLGELARSLGSGMPERTRTGPGEAR